jgi:hypothetical protein
MQKCYEVTIVLTTYLLKKPQRQAPCVLRTLLHASKEPDPQCSHTVGI